MKGLVPEIPVAAQDQSQSNQEYPVYRKFQYTPYYCFRKKMIRCCVFDVKYNLIQV